jgi:light-regulated signal transduction histidine kinase (bacteriophytochrome)
MMLLIKELLNYSKLSTSIETYSKLDLNKVMADIKEDFELLIRERKANIKVNQLPVIEGISLHIHQLFHNLISNSLKFCNENTPPEIIISARKLNQEEVECHPELNPELPYVNIEWRDNGIGFSQQYADQIFTIFQRLNNSQAYNGTGIGLALCKKIVTNHHGKIYAQSEEDNGATFHIMLPESQEGSIAI